MSKTKMTSKSASGGGASGRRPGGMAPDEDTASGTTESVDDFARRAAAWLESTGRPRRATNRRDTLALFPEWERPESVTWVDDARQWLSARYEAGFCGISMSRRSGGLGLTPRHEQAFELLEGDYDIPPAEIWGLGHHMVLPAIDRFGTDEQRERFVEPGLRGELIFCQLFSEPDAGSDLASLRTAAVRDGDRWIVNGQKVWTSVAHVSDVGMLLCRTDPDAPKHRGITCFLVPLRQPGVTVRPIRQITGGSAFNEVFLTDVPVADGLRLGATGDGWSITRATLNVERGSLSMAGPHVDPGRLADLARRRGRADDPSVRHAIVDAVIRKRITELTVDRVRAADPTGHDPGPLASTLKLMSTELLRSMGRAAAAVLGPAMIADTGEWGTYSWHRHLLETAGLRIGGGTDEIQRNIMAESVLGLPRQPVGPRG